MKVSVLLFCFGAGMLQNAMQRSYLSRICYGFFLLPDFVNRERCRNDPVPFFVIGLFTVTMAVTLIHWL